MEEADLDQDSCQASAVQIEYEWAIYRLFRLLLNRQCSR